MKKVGVLMSIKPEYANLIFDGSKTVELRRVCPKVSKGDLILVYVSGPRMALVGGFEVEGIVSGDPSTVRDICLTEACVSRSAFDRYFKGADNAYGIRIGRTWEFEKAAELRSLRKRRGGFRPPQSYRYLRDGEFKGLIA